MRLSNKSSDFTSFHNETIYTSVNALVKALGDPQEENNTGEDKVNFCWTCETSEGKVVTIYDWKESRKIDLDEIIEFHLGSKNPIDSFIGKEELMDIVF